MKPSQFVNSQNTPNAQQKIQQQNQQNTSNSYMNPQGLNLQNLNLSNSVDYREVTKTLNYLNSQQQKIDQKGPQSPYKNQQNPELQFLQQTGILNQEKKRNLEVDVNDIEKAFKILDDKNNGQKVSLNELKKKVPIINPNFSVNDIQSLTNGKQEIKSKDLFDILKDNELEDLDLFSESFQLLDPGKTGFLDIKRLEQIFQILGYGNLTRKDIEILNECLDLDQDGRISVNDLKQAFENTSNLKN